LCVLELSRLTRVEKAVKNTTIIVIYKVLVYIQMSQPTTMRISMFHRAFFNSIIDKRQHMRFFTFKTVLV